LTASWAQSRQTTLLKRLLAPDPSAGQLDYRFHAVAIEPDHGHSHLLPWRFVMLLQALCFRLAAVFKNALVVHDVHATPEQIDQAHEKGASPARVAAGAFSALWGCRR